MKKNSLKGASIKRTKTVTAENGQEIEVSMLIDEKGVQITYERLGKKEGVKSLSMLINATGVEIKGGFSSTLDPAEATVITNTVEKMLEEINPTI